MGSTKASLKGVRVQVIINGCVQFDQHVDVVDVTSILHAADDGLACEMQFAMKYGYRRPDGAIVVGEEYPPNVTCACGALVHADMPSVGRDNSGTLWHIDDENGKHRVHFNLP